jgi:hypothetical protein
MAQPLSGIMLVPVSEQCRRRVVPATMSSTASDLLICGILR